MKFWAFLSLRSLIKLVLVAVVSLGVIQCVGYWIFNRKVGRTESMIPNIVYTNASWREKWQAIESAIEKSPPLCSYHLFCRDFEWTKELILVAKLHAPEEKEGNGIVRSDAPCLQYLMMLYPEIRSKDNLAIIRVRDVYEILRDRQPSYWRIVWLSIQGG